MPALREAIGFDKYDLATNQRGKLTKRQQRKIIWHSLQRAPVLALVIVGVVIWSADTHGTNESVLFVKLLQETYAISMWTIIFGFLAAYQIVITILDLIPGKPAVVEGKIYLTLLRSGHIRDAIQVNSIKLEIPKTAKLHIMIGYIYRIYYAPNTKILLSIEKISTGNPNQEIN